MRFLQFFAPENKGFAITTTQFRHEWPKNRRSQMWPDLKNFYSLAYGCHVVAEERNHKNYQAPVPVYSALAMGAALAPPARGRRYLYLIRHRSRPRYLLSASRKTPLPRRHLFTLMCPANVQNSPIGGTRSTNPTASARSRRYSPNFLLHSLRLFNLMGPKAFN